MKVSKCFGWIVLVIIALVLAACALTPAPAAPTLRIDNPPSNTEVAAGQSVTVQATASDGRGIARMELLVDGKMVHSAEAPGPQPAFSAVLPWKAEGPGSHVVSVRYFTRDGVGSEPVAITLIVAGASAATATPLAGPTQTPARTATAGPSPAPTKAATAPVAPTVAPPTAVPTAAPPAPPTPIPCRYVATFVGETIPDGTVFLPGAAFTKIWRVRNDGNCPWTGGFQFVAIDGERMTSVAAIAVPETAPGGIAALTIGMTAPAAPGGHGGRWQLRTAQGAFFGPALSVSIVTAAPTPVPCIPVISAFGADRTTINRGESTVLRWGKVDSAERVEIDNGIGGVGTPGERTVAPNQTTTFTLVAACGGNTRQAQVTINVAQPQPTAVPQPTPVPQRRNVSGTWSAGNHSMQLQEALGCGGPTCGVAGEYSYWTGGTPEQGQVNGSVNVQNGSVSLNIVVAMPGAPVKTFHGTLSADSRQLSGTLSGVGQLTFVKQ
jgi:hypothetical protein